MQEKTWYSILGLDAEPLFLQEGMLIHNFIFSSNTLFVIMPSMLNVTVQSPSTALIQILDKSQQATMTAA